MKRGNKQPEPSALCRVVFCWLAVATAQAQTGPTITQQPLDQAIVVGGNVTFCIGVSGTGPFTYQWRFNGAILPNIITTVAGSGAYASPGDNGPATNASLTSPYGVTLDPFGNLYIADMGNNRIRKVDTNGVITTVAGTGPFYPGSGGYSGDGGPATNAMLNLPSSVAIDSAGNLIIGDTFNQRIRKVDTNGGITTVAGNGIAGYSGDNGPATNASLAYPDCTAPDAFGNLFIADSLNNIVRKVATNGIITTVGGNGVQAFAGDGGPATAASMDEPAGVALDQSGNLFIGDWGNDRIRKINARGMITTVAGNGNGSPEEGSYSGDGGPATNAGLYYPFGVAFDQSGNLYIGDSNNNRVRKVDTNGVITTVAGNGTYGYSGDGGAAGNASLSFPFGVFVDATGNIFVADSYNNRVREVPVQGPTLHLSNLASTNAGSYDVVVTSPYGSITSSVATLTILLPPGITTQPRSLIVGVGSNATLTVSNNGTAPFGYQWIFNTAPLPNQTNSALTIQAVDPTNAGSYQVVVTNLYGSATSSIVTLTVAFPPTVTNDPSSQTIVAGSAVRFSVGMSGTGPFTYHWRFNGTNLPIGVISTIAGSGSGGYSGDGGPATNAKLSGPVAVALDALGNLFIADSINNRIRKVGVNGVITTVAGTGSRAYSGDGGLATNAALATPSALAVDIFGNVFFADEGNNRIRKVDPSGVITTVAGIGPAYPVPGGYGGDGGLATNAALYHPMGVSLDLVGNLLIADTSNNRIREVGAAGVITTLAGNGTAGVVGDAGTATNAELRGPRAVAADPYSNLFIADTGNNKIRKVDADGIITTVAGTGIPGFLGNGSPATNAWLNSPGCVVADGAGNLIIADSANYLVRMVETNGIISTIAGGRFGVLGDGGPATNASLANPSGVASDQSGNLIIADNSNNRVRKVFLYLNEADPTRLAFQNITSANAGSYDVVVTSAYGSTTSTVATVTVVLPPLNASLTAGQGIQLQFSGSANTSYVLQAATNLMPPVDWQPLVTNAADTNGNWIFADTNTAANTARFYRLASP